MKEKFIGFIGYKDTELKDLWENAVFVVDTNILINFYKYTSKESTKSLLDILKKLKENNKLWIPHQVALEYFFNYESNMYKQQEGFKFLESELTKLTDNANKIMGKVKTQHPYITTDKFQFFINNLEESNMQLEAQIARELKDLPDVQTIHNDLLELLDGIIGEPYDQKKIDLIEKEGKDRYDHKVPPGFGDKDKQNKKVTRSYGEFRYQQLYGDLIVWNQIIDKATEEDNATSIIFITEDRKEDWWELNNQKQIKRPHPLLLQEFLNKTQQKFYMYRTENFVELAQKYLGANMTEEQVKSVTEDVKNIRRIEEQNEQKLLEKPIKYTIMDRIVTYLNDTERQILKTKLDKISYVDSAVAHIAYNEIAIWAFEIVLPRLESTYFKVSYQLINYNQIFGQSAIANFDGLPKELNPRIKELLDAIDYLSEELACYEEAATSKSNDN